MPNEQIDFLDRVMKLLAARQDSGIMILINGSHGFEMLSTHPDAVFQFGMLHAAYLTVDERFRQMILMGLKSGETEAHEEGMNAVLNDKPKGGVN